MVGDVRPGQHGRTAGLACKAHEPGRGLRDGIKQGALREWPRLAEARQRREDEPRVGLVQAFPAEAHRVERPRAVVLDHDVGPGDEPLEDGSGLGMARIERHG